MSNYPDDVDFSRMDGGGTPTQRSADFAKEREARREQDEIRLKAHEAARHAGAALRCLGLSDRSLEIIAEGLCEELIRDDYYAPALEALHGSYASIVAALVAAGRTTQAEEAA